MSEKRTLTTETGAQIESGNKTLDIVQKAFGQAVQQKQQTHPSKELVQKAFSKNFSNFPSVDNTVTVDQAAERVRLGVSTYDGLQNVESKLASNQSGLEQFGRTATNFGTGIVGGFASALGSTLDIKGTAEMLAGMDAEYGNMLGDWGRDFMEKNQMKIYEQNPGKSMQVLDSGWWGKVVGQSGLSLGIMIEALAETAAVTYATGGAGLTAELGNLASKFKLLKTARNMGALTELVKVASNSQKIKNAMMLTAGFRGMNELYMEGADTYRETKEKYQLMRDKGEIDLSDEQIQKISAEAATTTARWNLLKVANDVLQARLLTINPMSGGGTGAIESLFAKIPNKFVAGAAQMVGNAGLEGVEEWYQFIASREGVHAADVLAGKADGKDFGKRFMEYQRDGEIWDSFMGGVVGGVILGGAQTGVQKLMNGKQEKQLRQQHEGFINGLNGYGMRMAEQLQKFDQLGEVGKASALRRVMGEQKALTGLHLDSLKDSDAAFGGYMTFLNKTLEAAQKGDVTALQAEFGPQADIEWVKKAFPTYIQDAQMVQKLYNENKDVYDRDTVMSVTQRQFDLHETSQRLQDLNVSIEQAKLNTPDYASLSPEGKDMFDAYMQQSRAITKEQKLAANKRVEEMEGRQVSSAELNKDMEIIAAMNPENQVAKLYGLKYEAENTTEVLRKELTELQSKEFQAKNRKQRLSYLIETAEDSEQLDARASQIPKSELTPELENKIKSRRDALRIQEEKENLDRQTAVQNTTGGILSEVSEEETRAIAEDLKPILPGIGTPAVPIIPEDFENIQATALATEIEIESFSDPLAGVSTFTTSGTAFFSPSVEDSMSEEKKNSAKTKVKDFYEAVKKTLGTEPTYQELRARFAELKGEELAKKIEPVLTLGWKLNGYGNVQEELAKADALAEMLDGALEQQEVLKTEEDVKEANVQADLFHTLHTDGLQFDENESGDKIVKKPSVLKTISDTLKFAFRSIMNDSDAELIQDENINHKDLLNTNKYAAGTKVIAKIPPVEQLDKMLITIRNEDAEKIKTISFGEWKVDKTSSQIAEVIPVLIYNAEGEAVAQVHDIHWYNPSNIGKEQTPLEQQRIINEARKRVMDLRNHIIELNGKPLELTITEKKPGTVLISKEFGPINSKTPQSVIAVTTKTYDLATEKGAVPLSRITNPDHIKFYWDKTEGKWGKMKPSGYRYNLIPAGINENGETMYQATEVVFHPLSAAATSSVEAAVEVYISRFNPTAEIEHMHAEILRISKLDLYNVQDFEKYLNMFIGVNVDPATGTEDKMASLNSNVAKGKYTLGTPFVSVQQRALMFGILGLNWGTAPVRAKDGNGYETDEAGNTKKKPVEYLFISPPKAGETAQMERAMKNVKRFVEEVLPKFKQNISQAGMTEAKGAMAMVIKDAEGKRKVVTYKSTQGETSYGGYLKDQLTTDVRSINIGTAEKPVYTSFVQPTIHFNYKEDETAVMKNRAAQDAIEAVEKKNKIAGMFDPEELKAMGWSQDAINKAMGDSGEFFSPSVEMEESLNPSEENYDKITDAALSKVKKRLNTIEDLNADDRGEVVRSVARTVEERLDASGVSFTETNVNETIAQVMDEVVNTKRIQVSEKMETFRKLYAEGHIGFKDLIEQGDILLNNIDVLDKNWKTIKKEIVTEIDQTSSTGISEDAQESGEVEGNYSKTSLEKNGKDSVTAELKRFFSRIPEYSTNGEVRRGFLGFVTYPGFDYVYDQISDILSSPVDVHANFEDMIERLERASETKPWLTETVKRLVEAPDQVKRAWVSAMSNHTIKPKFLMWNLNRSKYSLKVYDTNATEKMRAIQTQWEENFKLSALSKLSVDEEYQLNQDAAAKALAIYNEWLTSGRMFKINPDSKEENKNLDEIREWMHTYFGLKVTRETIRELKLKGYSIKTITGNKTDTILWAQMFPIASKTDGLFGLLARQLEIIAHLSGDKLLFTEEDGFHPFNDMGSVLKKLANIEKKYTTSVSTMNYRDGDKTVYGRTPNKFGTQQLDKLRRNNGSMITAKRALPFDGTSENLRLMQEDADYRDKVSVDHIGIQAIQQMSKKTFGVNEITSLAEADYNLLNFGLFQDTKQGEVSSTTFNGIPMRMARMLFPTMSDKTTMLTLATAVMRLNRTHLMQGKEVKMSEDVKAVLFSQMIESEFKRIVSHHGKAKEMGVSPDSLTNQKGYNKGAQIFHFIPEMNNLQYKGIRLIKFLAETNLTDAQAKEVLGSIKEDAYALVEKVIEAETQKIIDSAKSSGFLVYKNDKLSEIKFMDSEYMRRELPDNVPMEDRLKMAAMDFAINSFYTHANHYMTFIGDIANFVVDSKVFTADSFENGIPYEPVNNEVYSKVAKQVLGVNTGKRLAYLLAPGTSLFNSVGDSYVQLFLDDKYSVSTNSEYLIQLYYGDKAVTKEVEAQLEKLRTSENEAELKTARKWLGKKFPSLSGYFKIEGTNAQEYTTAKEALDVVYRLGRIPATKYTALMQKLDNQYKAEQEGRPISEQDYISDEDRKLVFNPLKPVVTGHMQEDTHNRVIYVKTSSFPLLPQLTQGTELDHVRKALEAVQNRTGKNVRASYDSGNKVGSTAKTLSIWDASGKYIPGSISAEDIHAELRLGIDTSAMLMDRENFRIQQDVPFKAGKNSEDTTPLGTQMMKLFFGDGIADIEENIFDYGGKKVSGKDLHRTYNRLFDTWIRNEKNKLYESLGIDEVTGQPINKSKTIAKMKKLLKEEAEKRDFPLQDIQALDVAPVRNREGEIIDVQFAIPLWMSPNSNRYEALLNSIVTNRLLKLKLPGNSFVAGSEQGFKYASETSLTDKQKMGVVYTSSFTGELSAAELHKDGKLKKAQVFAPARFRNSDGKIIDLIKDGYAKQGEDGRWMLDEDRVSKELLTSTTFRIPTSGHSSMSQVEIVGFLPYDSGDLIILPKNFTEQMGLDFDVDKQNSYSLWHGVDENGKIVPLNELDENGSYEELEANEKWVRNRIEEYKEAAHIALEEVKESIKEYQDEVAEGIEDRKDYKFAKKRIIALKDELQDKKEKTSADLKLLREALSTIINNKSRFTQNEISRIYTSVLSSGDSRVQFKVNKLLSLDEAREQAELISSLEESEGEDLYSPLSPTYQREKMSLGAAGKSAIGIYSNYVVFHSLAQQTEKPLQMRELVFDPETGRQNWESYNLTIGNIRSDGKLGVMTTLGTSGRLVSEVLGERQNTALDNEKEQIMGRVGVNELTINVDSIMSLMGFDQDTFTNEKGETVKASIPYFILSQPIIREYVTMMRNGKSTIAEFNKNLESEVIQALYTKYGGNDTYTAQDKIDHRRELTGKKLYENLSRTPNDITQQTVLHLFLELNKFAEDLRTLQSRLNIQGSGLGKSAFEMLDKYDNVEKLSYGGSIENVDSLIGHYIKGKDFEDNEESIKHYIDNGYVIFRPSVSMDSSEKGTKTPFAVRPTTFTGSLVVHAAKTGYDLWADFFPHRNPVIRAEIEYAINLMSDEDTSDAKKIELKYKVFEEMKKFMFSSDRLGVFSGDPQQQRARLFFDTSTNVSLANYLNSIAEDKTYTGSEAVRRNKIISRFRYTFERNSPSLIKFDNNKGEDANEEYKYSALIELMDKDLPLPNYNGEPYSTRKLGADLLSYAYLEGGIQEAIQFVKYIPIPLLQVIGFSETTQHWQWAASQPNKPGEGNLEKMLMMFGRGVNGFSRFTRQFAQHNASSLYKRTEDDIKEGFDAKGNLTKNLAYMDTLVFKRDLKRPFVSIYNENIKGKKNKFQLYQFDGQVYRRIPTLGTFGMSEYSLKSDNVIPLVATPKRMVKPVAPIPVVIAEEVPVSTNEPMFKMSEGNLQTTLQAIVDENMPLLSELAKTFMPFIDHTVKFSVSDAISSTGVRANGLYVHGPHEIIMDKVFLAKPSTTKEEAAKIFLEEFIHSITIQQLKKYLNADGSIKDKTKGIPAPVLKLHRLFTEVNKHFGKELEDFRAHFEKAGTLRNNDKDALLYSGINIYEFTARIAANPDVLKGMSEIPYKETDKTLLQQFVEAIRDILRMAGIDIQKGSVAEQGLNAVYQFIKEEQQEEERQRELENEVFLEQQLREAEQELLDKGIDPNYDMGEQENPEGPAEDVLSPASEDVKKGVSELFENNPELFKIGTQQQYSAYLDTIFPDSKVKEIKWHGSKQKITQFQKGFSQRENIGIWFQSTAQPAALYKSDNYIKPYGDFNTAVILDIKNPIILPNKEVVGKIQNIEFSIMGNNLTKIQNLGYDAVTNDTLTFEELDNIKNNPKNFKVYETVVFEPEQIHILGSKQDIEGFENFIKTDEQKKKCPF